jgi:hypothetical protein
VVVSLTGRNENVVFYKVTINDLTFLAADIHHSNNNGFSIE